MFPSSRNRWVPPQLSPVYLLNWSSFRYPSAFSNAGGLKARIQWSKAWCSGLICRPCCPRGRIWSNFASSSLGRRCGVTPLLKRGSVSAALLLLPLTGNRTGATTPQARHLRGPGGSPSLTVG
jgi:hypothetical protein